MVTDEKTLLLTVVEGSLDSMFNWQAFSKKSFSTTWKMHPQAPQTIMF